MDAAARPPDPGSASPVWPARAAGSVLAAVGLANVVFGVLSLTSRTVLLSTGVAGGLVVAGLVTAALGVLVWRGSPLARAVALAVFGLLLVVQLAELATGGSDGGGARLAVLAVLVAALGVAQLRAAPSRRRSATTDRGTAP